MNIWSGLARLAVALAAAGTLGACATTAAPPAATQSCAPTARAPYADGVIHVFRIETDPATKDSRVVPSVLDPKITALMQTGGTIREFNFGAANKVQIVSGPANFDIPMHPSPYLESFLLLEGSVTVAFADGTTLVQRPGDMLVMADTDAIHGHGGRTGPCGYVSLNIVPR